MEIKKLEKKVDHLNYNKSNTLMKGSHMFFNVTQTQNETDTDHIST